MGRHRFAYNTNGMAHHRLEEAIELLYELGYQGVAITPDVHHLDPYSPRHAEEASVIRGLLERFQLDLVIETGARFNLDFRRKHYPSLMCRRDRGRRIDFLKRCLHLARDLGSNVVALWSGHNFDGLPTEDASDLLVSGLKEVCAHAEELGVDVAFEPEPGMFVETLDGYSCIREKVNSPRLGLALDLGHLMVTEECEIPDAIRRHRGDLLTLTIEDMRRGIHEHLPFGQGDMDFDPIFTAIDEIGYRGPIIVELSRSSPTAPETAGAALRFLQKL